MAPKAPEKLHNQQQQQQLHKIQLHNNTAVVKHSNPFYISAHTLCHNKRLRLKRSKYVAYLQNYVAANPMLTSTSSVIQTLKTEAYRRQKLSLLQADVTIDLLSDDDDGQCSAKHSVNVHPERMCVERAAILGLMPVERLKMHRQPMSPPPLVSLHNNHNMAQLSITNVRTLQSEMPAPPNTAAAARKRKSRPQKRRSLHVPSPTAINSLTRLSLPLQPPPIVLNNESIVLSDDDEPEISITCPSSNIIPCLTPQNTMQVDEEVTISLVPRSLTATSCASKSLTSTTPAAAALQNSSAFPMLPDETTVHTVIANRIYELSLTKLREGLASCGIPEFADGQQKISPQRRKGMQQQPPLVSPPQAPISLKLSSDLSISLISDDEDDSRQRHNKHEHLLSPAFLQKLPVNVSIAPVPMMMMRPQTNSTEPRKLKLG